MIACLVEVERLEILTFCVVVQGPSFVSSKVILAMLPFSLYIRL